MLKTILSLSLVAVVGCGCSKNSGRAGSTSTAAPAARSSSGSLQNVSGEFRTKVPEGWITEKPTSDMRVAQYKLPKVAGDGEDAILIVYYFGQGQGGSAEANIDRWIGQIKQPDGGSSKDKAKIEARTVNGLHVDTVDVLGNYSGGMSPDTAPADNKSLYRLRGAIVETPKGSYFIKLTGPEKTMNHWDQAYAAYINSFEFK